MRILLPDDTELQLDDGATGADAAAAIGAGLARAALAVKVDGELQRPLRAAARRRAAGDRHAVERRRARAAAPRRRARARRRRDGPLPGREDLDRAADRERLLLRLRVPRRRHDLRRRLRAHRGEDARARQGRRAVRARGRLGRRGARALRARGPALQGRADRGPRHETRASRPSRSTRTARSPTSAAARTAPARSASRRSSCSRSPAPTGAATRAARCSRASTAPPSSPRRSWPSTWSGSRRRRRATTASSARELGLFRFSPVAPAPPSGCRTARASSTRSSRSRREMGERAGYTEVKTPQIFDSELWETSGHWGKYRENMFVDEAEDRADGDQADELPGHAHLFASERHSYRDLPIRYSEPGLLHRNEPSGHAARPAARAPLRAGRRPHLLHRGAGAGGGASAASTSPSRRYGLFGFDVQLELSTRPGEAHRQRRDVGPRRGRRCARRWRTAGLDYELNEGDGAFYGPKIDFHVNDSLGRSWQLGTVQLDYSMPERFGLSYTGADDSRAPAGDDPPRRCSAPSSASSGS